MNSESLLEQIEQDFFANFPEEMSVKELCQRYPIGRTTVFNSISAGDLQATKKGRKYFITKKSFISYMEKKNPIDLLMKRL